MPFRPIDPAKRYASSAPKRPAPRHPPHPALETTSTKANAIVARARTRSLAVTLAPNAAAVSARQAREPARRAHHVVDRTGANWDNGDYIVGKNRPPKSAQWQKGQSGNPKGPKPREKLDPEAAFEKEVLASFTAKVNGQDVELNMGTFALQILKAGAAKGGVKSQ